MAIVGVVDCSQYKVTQEAGGRRQEAGRTASPGSDVGLDTARVR